MGATTTVNTTAAPERAAYSIAEFCHRNSVGRTLTYKEIASGRLRVRKAGKRTLITADSEREWLEALPEGR